MVPDARLTRTTRSSSGWRSDSSACTGNSGTSSRNSAPRCARLTSPGRTRLEPPPTSETIDALWCGWRNGGSVRSAGPRWTPAAEWILVTSSASARSSGARIVGRRRASIVLPMPGGPTNSRWCAPAAATESARRACARPRTSARSSGSSPSGTADSIGGGIGWIGPRGLALQAEVELAEAARDPDQRARHECRLGAFAAGTTTCSTPVRTSASTSASVPTTGRTPPSRPSSPSTPTPSSAPAGSPPPAHVERERDAELEPGAGLAHRRGREVHRHPLLRVLETGRQQGRAHPLARLPPGRVGQTDDRVAGQTPGDVHLDGDDPAVDAFEHGTAHGCEHG